MLLRNLVISLFGTLLSACSTATVSLEAIDLHTQELALQHRDKLQVVISADESAQPVGSQFVLMALPAGNVKISSPSEILWRAAYGPIVAAGFLPVLADTTSSTEPSLVLHDFDIKLSAYDRLIVRKIVCKIGLSATLSRPAGINGAVRADTPIRSERIDTERIDTERIELEGSEYSRYGFEKDLSRVLDRTLSQAISKLISRLLDGRNI